MTTPADTRPWLIRRTAALLVATVLACGALLAAYYGVSRDAAQVPDRTVPAMGHVAATEKALRDSLKAATASLRGPAAATEGTGEDYRAKINAAFRSLEKASATTVAGSAGQSALSTVAGQLSSYDYLVGQAARSHADEKLRDAYLHYADSTLNRKKSGIIARLAGVQDRQAAVLKSQTSTGWLLKLAWGAAVLLWCALAWLLVDTQLFLRRRFRRRFNGPLAGATVLLAGLVPLLLTAALQLRDDLGRAYRAAGGGDVSGSVPETVRGHMQDTHWLTAVPAWILLAGVVIAALTVLGLQPRIEEYRFARVPQSLGRRIRSFEAATVLLALWLVLFCAAGSGDARSEHHGRITVLAPWTDTEEARFRQVLDAYSAKYHVDVDYQGTTALREVLLSRLNAGNAPDVAILPSLGEVREYVGSETPPRELAPVLGDALEGYGPLWAPAIGGKVYGIAVKADLKSVVWYDPARRQDLRALAARGGQWCAGMGGDATSGWPGTDWIEDILLQQSGKEVYEQWARGELEWSRGAVADAWRTFGGIFDRGAATAALSQDFAKSVFSSQCALQHQGSFIRDSDYTRRAAFVPTREVLPGIARRPASSEVSADFATLFGKSAAARDLMRFLASPQGQRAWAEAPPGPGEGGQQGAAGTAAKDPGNPGRPFFVTADAPQPGPSERVNDAVGKALRDRQRPKCLDASDVMPLRMRFAFQHGVLDYLADPGPERQQKVLGYLDSVQKDLKAPPRAAGSPPRVCE
ncbi:ABC transporter substrate-binding protein [Streptomyces telluris]|uniref:Extracellular solute-binding protein n=1 Tax=Streptomyces telluris TaxID=2720021 RepID=A0A9X2LKK2_9ACTN|nr:extracellular solute-binding protein [Streptomyces telluris]MCQ8772967.1 extracellular solute-binding protein [Streptomyces telluris]NJP78315.1 extracellular solute-binding protein [Streptomyces telluris]